MIKRFYLSLFFARRFYALFVAVIVLFTLSFGIPWLFLTAQLSAALLFMTAIFDWVLLFSRRQAVLIRRVLPDKLSNGDLNSVQLFAGNQYPFRVSLRIIDELPDQFQQRDLSIRCVLEEGEQRKMEYSVRPGRRGEYLFHAINVFIKSPVGMIVRRKIAEGEKMVKVWPSYFELKKYELAALSNNLQESGNNRIRKLGQSLEFEQIKEYVAGDDIRNINWKATARRGGQLMVNNYMDERSQQVYCLIDKGRIMKMPFGGMSLLDYAINATLILSRVALIKQDKAGLLTFADQPGTFLPASRKAMQMTSILESLYNQQTRFLETDYEKLYALVKTRIPQRSLLVLFTNFESLSGLHRQLPYIRGMARNHLLLVVFFENTGLEELRQAEAEDVEGLYIRTIAEKFAYEKRLIVKELHQHGIATILTPPEQLTIHTVNKYLEIKARQAI
jgi:uncharacterized protein (DUF58 family)